MLDHEAVGVCKESLLKVKEAMSLMSLLRVSEIETKIQEWAAQLVERVVHIDLGFAAIVCKAFDDEELEHDGSERDFAESVRQAAVISAAFTDDSELESLANMLTRLGR